MKIGIFGGCFNPPHKMHKNIAEDLIKGGYLDKVIYVPTGNSYNKKDLIDFDNRLSMLKLMVDNKNLLVSDIGNNDNYKYTYQTLDYFKSIYKEAELYFICGTDNLKEFTTWKNYEYILENYKLLIIKRNDDDELELLQKYKKYKDSIVLTNVKPYFISSTSIRQKLRERKDILKYIDSSVYNYIKNKKLYIYD